MLKEVAATPANSEASTSKKAILQGVQNASALERPNVAIQHTCSGLK